MIPTWAYISGGAVAIALVFGSGFHIGRIVEENATTAELEECADGIIKGKVGTCPSSVRNAFTVRIEAQKKDVAQTQVEYRDRIIPVINQGGARDRSRERQLEQDLERLRNVVENSQKCVASEPINTVRDQLCALGSAGDCPS